MRLHCSLLIQNPNVVTKICQKHVQISCHRKSPTYVFTQRMCFLGLIGAAASAGTASTAPASLSSPAEAAAFFGGG